MELSIICGLCLYFAGHGKRAKGKVELSMNINEDIVFAMEIIGTIAFASSGALVAIRKNLDIFGIVVLGAVTAVGGGILRDIILGKIPPNIFIKPVYFMVALATVLVIFCLFWFLPKLQDEKNMDAIERYMNIFDAVGLGAFTVIGIDAAVLAGYGTNYYFMVFLGVTTGIGGGILRDIMACEIPYVLRKHIYACASLAGGIVYVMIFKFVSDGTALAVSVAVVVVIRLLASHFKWNLAKLKK